MKFSSVSIIVPYFNAAGTISRTIESILTQDCNAIELLLVDDSSTDKGVELVERYAASDPRVVSLRSPRKGANVARQVGVANASGAYIAFVDADDCLVPGALGKMLRRALESKADLVCGNVLVDRRGQCHLMASYARTTDVVTLTECPEAAAEVVPSACAKLFCSSLLKGVDFENVPFTQDWNISYGALARAERVCFTNDAYYVYYRRGGSTSAHSKALSIDDVRAVTRSIEGVVRQFEDAGRLPKFREALEDICTRFFLNLVVRSYAVDGYVTRYRLRKVIKSRFFEIATLCGTDGQVSRRAERVGLLKACVNSLLGYEASRLMFKLRAHLRALRIGALEVARCE